MDKDSLTNFINKEVLIILKNGYKYHCVITNLFNTSLNIVDVKQNFLAISYDDISVVKFERMKTKEELEDEKNMKQ